MLEKDLEMRAFFDNCPDTGPLKLRDCFMGGRTGPEYLYAASDAYKDVEPDHEQLECSKGTTMKLKDVKSLYPAM